MKKKEVVDMAMRRTYDVVTSVGPILNFGTKEEAEKWIKRAVKTGFANLSEIEFKVVPTQSKPYKFGDKWRYDFDYVGMLETGAKANLDWGAKKLEKLFDSFEDVNYHEESRPLNKAIYYLQLGAYKDAKRELAKFKEMCGDALKEISRDK